MILARVEIDNYKQYRGHHEFRIPTEATIGVIGANGVGKTTLFEAIDGASTVRRRLPPKTSARAVTVGRRRFRSSSSAATEKGQFIVERD